MPRQISVYQQDEDIESAREWHCLLSKVVVESWEEWGWGWGWVYAQTNKW